MYDPQFSITPAIASNLVRIERLAADLRHLTISPALLQGLRETAKIHTVHYSTVIEGNQLTVAEVQTVIHDAEAKPGQTRDEAEVRGYTLALNRIADWIEADAEVTEERIRTIHALVMAGGRSTVKPTPYRDQQNVIRSASSGGITYMPPEPDDVAPLMVEFVAWLRSDAADLPAPLIAGIAHYQFVTIHPYMDGNGRTARLLTTWLMRRGGYDLGGVYSLEEHYVRNLAAYYASLALGPSHNYYFGRETADITPWLEYFCHGVVKAFEAVHAQAEQLIDASPDQAIPPAAYRDPRKRRVIEEFAANPFVRAVDLATLFDLKPRSASHLAQQWVEDGFLRVENPSRKNRLYRIVLD